MAFEFYVGLGKVFTTQCDKKQYNIWYLLFNYFTITCLVQLEFNLYEEVR